MKNLFQRIKHRKFVYTQPFQHIVYRNLINLEEFDKVKPLASFNNDEKNVKIVIDFNKYKDYNDEETI